MTKEIEELSKRFELMRSYAANLYKALPDQFEADEVDGRFFELLIARRFNEDRKRYTEEEIEAFLMKYRGLYIECKRSNRLNQEIYMKHKELKLKYSTLISELVKRDMPYTVTGSMIKVFELIGTIIFDELTAEKMKENLLPLWLTGCKLDEEERKEVLKGLPKNIYREGE